MKSDYITRAQRFINQFFEGINPYRIPNHDMEFYTYMFNEEHHRKVHFESGATRYAFVTSDYVVKVDYKSRAKWAGNSSREYALYQRIKDSDMSYLFAEITRYKFEGVYYYIMPRVHNIDNYRDEEIEYFLTEEETDFLYYDLGLHDLHNGNYGLKNNKPIIFDYAFYD